MKSYLKGKWISGLSSQQGYSNFYLNSECLNTNSWPKSTSSCYNFCALCTQVVWLTHPYLSDCLKLLLIKFTWASALALGPQDFCLKRYLVMNIKMPMHMLIHSYHLIHSTHGLCIVLIFFIGFPKFVTNFWGIVGFINDYRIINNQRLCGWWNTCLASRVLWFQSKLKTSFLWFSSFPPCEH